MKHRKEEARLLDAIEAKLPQLEALSMVCKYGRELETPPKLLPSGWAAVLSLYGMR